MTCPRCQTENPPQANFCLECATPLRAGCVNCGTALPAAAKFCYACAHPVGSSRESSARPTPETYTPRHLAEAILSSRAALEGERQQVTVLFADLKGSMELLADRDPEEARKILDPVLERMMEAVHRYEGTVNQVMGDGIMALFGAPVAHEDHAVRACYAALRMQERVKRYAEEVREDLHWIDGETQAVLDSLVESVPAARVLVLVNYRPDYQHGWGRKTYYTQLRLDALAEESAAQLLNALVGEDTSLEPFRQMLIARTGGNPFFLEESVRTLLETNRLVGEPGAYRLGQPVDALQIPASVQAVLAARIDRLPPDDKRLLQAAAVLGQDVPVVLLEAIADLPDDALRASLVRLRAAEFLRETMLFPGAEYTFTHALTHDVAYSSLLSERRRALHLRILGALEEPSADPATRDVERLARHALGGEAWRKAATYLRQAGRRAASQSAYQAAATWFGEALRSLQQVPESPDVLAEAIDARLDFRIALIPLQRYQDALTVMREAEALAMRLGDLPRLGWVLADLCARLRNVLGEHRQAVEVGRRALAIATECGNHALDLEATYRTGQAYFALGDYGEAIDLLSRSMSRAGEREQQDPTFRLFASWSHAWLAMALSNLGRFGEGMWHAAEAVRIAEAADHPFTVVEALTALGGVALAQGDLDHAIGALERGVALGREWKFQPWATLSRLGYAYALSARLSDARRVLEEIARSNTTLSSMGIGRAMQVAWLAETYALDGRLDDAAERAQEALSLAQAHEEHGHEAYVHRLLGEISVLRGDLPEALAAENHYRDCLSLATHLDMRPLIAHCHLGLGKLWRRAGRRDQAREYLTTAVTMYRDMNMVSWLEQAEAEMRELA
jgi:tetratricopeptide (TPR) repeat protein